MMKTQNYPQKQFFCKTGSSHLQFRLLSMTRVPSVPIPSRSARTHSPHAVLSDYGIPSNQGLSPLLCYNRLPRSIVLLPLCRDRHQQGYGLLQLNEAYDTTFSSSRFHHSLFLSQTYSEEMKESFIISCENGSTLPIGCTNSICVLSYLSI